MTRLTLFSLAILIGCSTKDSGATDTDAVGESNTNTDTDTDTGTEADTGSPALCTADIKGLDPQDTDDGWFYRDRLTIEFEVVPEFEAVRFSLTDASGADVPFTVTWNPEHSLDAYIAADLTGSTVYTLSVGCQNDMSATFQTSEYGSPFVGDPTTLVGNVYELDLPNANFTEPPAVGALLGSYLTSPLLASVQAVTDDALTLLVAQGIWDEDGIAHQDMGTGTYDFPPADFSAAPFFVASTDLIDIVYQSGSTTANIPMHNMRLEGTFAPDGTSLGGAWIGGLVDTRNLGPLLEIGDSGDDEVVCEYLSVFGVDCIDCGDGDELCLYVEAHFGDADLIPGLTLDPDPLGR
jgi:hypothetical protein